MSGNSHLDILHPSPDRKKLIDKNIALGVGRTWHGPRKHHNVLSLYRAAVEKSRRQNLNPSIESSSENLSQFAACMDGLYCFLVLRYAMHDVKHAHTARLVSPIRSR
jgi:hypothetical protein